MIDLKTNVMLATGLRKEFRKIIEKINKDYNLYNNVMDLIEKNKFYGEIDE